MNKTQKTSVFANSLVWFGAAVSIAEILTGTRFAPLGFWKGLATIICGHIIGGSLLYLAGLLGARYECSAMETAKRTFGERGGQFFALLNVIQLVGWTAVMIASGADSANAVMPLSAWCWALIIATLVLVWILAGIGVLKKLNGVTTILLFVLSVALCRVIISSRGTMAVVEGNAGLGFGEALELSVAMPVSWLPLIADYTSTVSHPKANCLVSTLVYCVISCWMYIIGMGAASMAGEADIAVILLKNGLGLAAVLIVVLSTVTTTFLDVYSAGVSARSIWRGAGIKCAAAVACILGTILAIVSNTSIFENFLYWIGSVFVPMITIQIMDGFVLCPSGRRSSAIHHLAVWGMGFVLYRVALLLNLPCGSTIPVIIATALLCLVPRKTGRTTP